MLARALDEGFLRNLQEFFCINAARSERRRKIIIGGIPETALSVLQFECVRNNVIPALVMV